MNECLTNNGGCAQICTDTPNAFECSCNFGFILASDGLGCDGKTIFVIRMEFEWFSADVNECSTSNGGCEDICFNVDGSFLCFCSTPGFILSSDALTCEGIS